MFRYYIIFLLSLSLFSALAYGRDKILSLDERNNRRTPEVILITLTALGGALGSSLGMIFFGHKANMSKKWHFFIILVTSAIIQLAVLPIIFFFFT